MSELRRRARAAGALATVAALALIFAPGARAASSGEVAALQAAPCPTEYNVLFRDTYSAAEQQAALDGDFDVLLGRRGHLVPPVDWSMDPYGSRSWRTWLHTWWWSDALLYIYRQGGPNALEALAHARDLALDWIASNPEGPPDNLNYPWGGATTAQRAAFFAFLARAAACEGMLSDAQAGTLLDSLRYHGNFMAGYYAANDHGRITDYCLAAIGRYLPFLPESEGWQEVAIERFAPAVLKRFNTEEDMWLVNTPAYQATVAMLLDFWLADIDSDPELASISAQMRWGVGWFVLPDGGLVPSGDHHTMSPLPPWIPAIGAQHRGLRTMLDSGYAVVKLRRAYFAAAASFFFKTHKQADDLNFELFDRGHRIVTDTGHYDYDFGAWQRFQQSTQAHSVLSVDGKDFPFADPRRAYGSGMLATGKGHGWYAALGTNPLVRRQGVRHRRFYLYGPHEALFVADVVRAKRRHVYRRYVQLGPDIEQRSRGRKLVLSASGFRGSLRSSGGPSKRSTVRGETDPIGGWTFPDYREKMPRWTVAYRSRAKNANYLISLGLDGRHSPRARILDGSRRRLELAVSTPGEPDSKLTVSRRKGSLSIVRTNAER